MSPHITLYQHQKDAVWRIMSSGNTLLAHAVGAGKTNVMVAAGMKMRQAGLITKPLYVVPNHMLEQFGREFLQLYPNAKLLIATKEDFTRARRKLLTARIASGDWDGIITTHSSFERIGMSQAFQERFLRAQIAAYDQLLCESAAAETSRAHRNIIKTIEKQKAKREERLKALLAEEKKDDGLVFDELGVDHIYIDEAHYFKNLETPTKMERVAGIQTSGSERAFDLYMKTQYLHQQHPGHGVTFATGTPISNTMVELYTLQRFLDPDGLEARGLAHFDAWAATFGEVVDAMELAPDGASLRPRSRFARFTNLPELQQMFRSYADVQTAAMLHLPRPRLTGDKATVIACPMSDEQCDIQATLVARYEAIRSGQVKPWEDNALAITTDGRKLALDARLLSATATDVPDSKIKALVANVTAKGQNIHTTA
jgi:N12 class adenine-specific DNA methylase